MSKIFKVTKYDYVLCKYIIKKYFDTLVEAKNYILNELNERYMFSSELYNNDETIDFGFGPKKVINCRDYYYSDNSSITEFIFE